MYISLAVGILQIFAGASNFKAEQEKATPYSKFANLGQEKGKWILHGRAGMLVLYLLPTIWCTRVALTTWSEAFPGGLGDSTVSDIASSSLMRSAVIAAMYASHFGKRELEVLFVHNYSGSGGMLGGLAVAISMFYSLHAALVMSFQRTVPATAYSGTLATVTFIAGLALFLAGEAGNFYHHFLLAQLRRSGSDKSYHVPQGGLFSLVAMPHYFCELFVWLGIALVASQFNAFCACILTGGYLCGRAKTTTEWYLTKVPNYPSDRRHIIPFIF
mmetsp:Transcript_52574/g.125550  ORF Transcript_52574/g.125550 Transcript_52574/m.125550 type:complete len:273 (+) Transcript_52574:81-899(+)